MQDRILYAVFGIQIPPETARTKDLDTILNKYGEHIEYISFGVEGDNLFIINKCFHTELGKPWAQLSMTEFQNVDADELVTICNQERFEIVQYPRIIVGYT